MMKRTFVKSTALATALIASSALLTACSSTPRTDARLEAARTQLSEVQAKGTATDTVPVEVTDAQEAIATADRALSEREDKEEIDHKVYLAQQRVAIAQQAQAHKAADLAQQELVKRRDKERLEARTAEAERAKAELKDLQAQMTERGVVMTLGDVLFDVGKSNLKAGGVRMVAKLAAYLNANPQRKVSIEGHTDSTGSDEMNQRLSEARADSVKGALIDAGVSSERIATQGYGEAYPVASNDSSASRQLNRRVEIVLSDESGAITPR